MTEPIFLKAFDRRLKINGDTLPVDCYVVAAGKYDEMNSKITKLEQQLAESQKDLAFYRCCALSGEVPKEGSQPSAINPPSGVSDD